MLFLSILLVSMLLNQFAVSGQVESLEELLILLEQSGTNAKVGFLTASNYASVKNLLPPNVQPVYVENDADLVGIVLNDTVMAGLMSGLPEQQYHKSLNLISSRIITMHAMLIAPQYSTEYPQGVQNQDLSTLDLSHAINAAIAKVQMLGIDEQLARKNAPKEIVFAHTCKDDELSQFPLPNKGEAKGLLKKILQEKIIKVLANGPYNWGTNDGNYLADPPVGFYPDILQAIVEQMQNLSGPDGQTYGRIEISRVYSKDDYFPWYMLFDGSAHVSEPYFIYDSPYSGSGKNCKTDQDCPNAVDPPERKETCNSKGFCQGPLRPRSLSFRPACTVLGTESNFITKKSATTETSSEDSLDAGIIAALVILSIAVAILIAFLIVLVVWEKRGKPIFV